LLGSAAGAGDCDSTHATLVFDVEVIGGEVNLIELNYNPNRSDWGFLWELFKAFFVLLRARYLLGQDLFYEVSSQFCRVFVGLYLFSVDWSVE
jgi:hypothetical protein